MTSTETHQAPATPATPSKQFGTFLGVYTPSVLTILGVMMYLRFGWVVGNVGLPLSVVIVVAASSITFITGLSASAVASNMRVGVGGEYFMVSRSLGLEFGGAIGIPLFLCRTLSLTLYAFGLAESLLFLWPSAWGAAPPLQIVSAVIIVLTTAIAGRSAELSLKLQMPIMLAVGASLVALTVGVVTGGFASPEWIPHYERSASGGFWFVFAVFFPAVTGFTAGIGMSGDLADPKRSIPRGTILAVVTGTLVYLFVMLLLSTTTRVSGVDLASLDPNAPPIWTKIAALGFWFVFPGMWGAILSSAFGSALGGPRVLQALANDGLAPRFLGRTSRTGQPTIATWVTGAIALAAVLLGNLNAVGRWVTIFFLTLYVTINLAAAIESLVKDPSYRPTIKVPWFVSLAGSVGAIVVMFLVNHWACVSAIGLEMLLYLHLRRKAMRSAWGDVRAGFWTAIARFSLLQLRNREKLARNWRPNILVFTANPSSRMGLVRMGNWFNQNRGIVTVCQVVEGDLTHDDVGVPVRAEKIDQALRAKRLVAFSEIAVVPKFEQGVVGIAQANGFAGLHSNTLMFGWPHSAAGLAMLLRINRTVARVQKSVILARLPTADGPSSCESIDVWWRGKQNNGDLMLLLAHLLNLNPEWRRAKVTVRTIVTTREEQDEMRKRLDELVREARISAKTDVIVRPADESTVHVMHRASRKADVVFLGLNIPEPGQEEPYAERLMELSEGFDAAVFVRNNGPFAGELI